MNEKEIIIINPYFKKNRYNKDYYLQEAKDLIKSINLCIYYSLSIGIDKINTRTYLNSGNISKLCKIKTEANIDIIYINARLTPIQQRNLEKIINCKFIDRTGLILEIFGARAKSNEGKLQVRLASLEYQKSRLVRSWTHLERQRGGAGFMGGPGERQIESDRRQLTEQINNLKKKILSLNKTRDLQRYRRKKNKVPIVSIVGYTNSGKSTLFNFLTKSETLVKNMLFATLDSSIRKCHLNNNNIILIDTVGFIRDLPTHLIAAFKSTLDEIISSDLILHVRDISENEKEIHANAVLKVLNELGVKNNDSRIIEVFNKIDLIKNDLLFENKNYISAISGLGIGSLKKKIFERLF